MNVKNLASGRIMKVEGVVLDPSTYVYTATTKLDDSWFEQNICFTRRGENESGLTTLNLVQGWQITKEEPTPETEYKEEPKQKVAVKVEGIDLDSIKLEELPSEWAVFKPVADTVIRNMKTLIWNYGIASSQPAVTIVLDPQTFQKREIEGQTCKDFETLCNIVKSGTNLYLFGPAGTGKSYTCQLIAQALGLDYYEQGKAIFDTDLKGYNDANGDFVETPFYKAFRYGGLFNFDEMDASEAPAIVVLNNAIANGIFDFGGKIGQIRKHKDFHMIACGNTRMDGADSKYTARCVVDASSVNRYMFWYMDYDDRIEMSCANNDKSLVDFIHAYRKACKDTSIDSIASYRDITRIVTFSKMLPDDVNLNSSLTRFMDKDNVSIIVGKMKSDGFDTSNKWFKALNKLAK